MIDRFSVEFSWSSQYSKAEDVFCIYAAQLHSDKWNKSIRIL